MDALKLLQQDHERAKSLLEDLEAAEGTRRQKAFSALKDELETHAYIEEEEFYPVMQEKDELHDMVLESIEEHRHVKILLKEMDALVDGSDKFAAKLKLLKENVTHHAEEEEEGKMFPRVRKLFSDDELSKIGERLERAKRG